MKKNMIPKVVFLSLVCILSNSLGAGILFAANTPAAIRSLERAISLLGAGEWQEASFEASLGYSYDPSFADFPYIEALALYAQNAPRHDVLEKLEFSLAEGLFWRSYTRLDALVVCAKLYVETLRYQEAMQLLISIPEQQSADAQLSRINALYGLKEIKKAHSALSAALDRWPHDSRFARLFYIRQKALSPTKDSLAIASIINSRLFLWEQDDRELLLLSVPFEPDLETRKRNIVVYRSMGKSDTDTVKKPLSALFALEYGLINEEDAFSEIFLHAREGLPREYLSVFASLIGSSAIKNKFEQYLSSFDGVLLYDDTHDSIYEGQVRYWLGRPVEAFFDTNQDGIADFSISCALGEPFLVRVPKNGMTVIYDQYPFVKRVQFEDGSFYDLKPLSLSYAPVEWVRKDFQGNENSFFELQKNTKSTSITHTLLRSHSIRFTQSSSFREGGVQITSINNGLPVYSEERFMNTVYLVTTYERGVPVLTREDRDDDGYFETTSYYSVLGEKIKIEIDANANRKIEYRELLSPSDGAITIQWDQDENGIFEISWTKNPSGKEITTFLDASGKTVTIIHESGKPRSVERDGVVIPVIQAPVSEVFFLGTLPPNALEIISHIQVFFNHSNTSVVSHTQLLSGYRIQAVQTGGLIFIDAVMEKK